MGTLAAPKDEILENQSTDPAHRNNQPHTQSSGQIETTAGAAEHNGRMDWERGTPRPRKPGQATMANELLTRPQTQPATSYGEGHELDAFLGKAFEEKPLWVDLYQSVRDVFF